MPSLRLASIALLLPFAGCFVYSPAETRNTPAGKLIEVALTPEGARALEEHVGPSALVVSGVLLGDDSEAIALRYSRVRRTDGKDLAAASIDVRIPHEHVVSVYERRISKPRTWMASVTGLAALAFLNRSR